MLACINFGISCKSDDNSGSSGTQTEIQLEFTDAAIDDDNIEGVFITVAEAKLSGRADAQIQQRSTIEISSFTGGESFDYGSFITQAGSYTDLEFSLDFAADASGVAPGCYVLLRDGTKQALKAGTSNLTKITKPLALNATVNSTQRVVIDLDLRKAVQRDQNEDYSFGTASNLSSSTRAVVASNSGTVVGKVNNPERYENGKAVAFLYARGSFSSDTEATSEYRGALTSTTVDANGNFKLGFVPADNYDLTIVYYQPSNEPNRYEAAGQFSLDIASALSLRLLSVEASSQTELSLDLGLIL